jgi:hypothetical protein
MPAKARRDDNHPLWPYPASSPKTFTLSRLDSLKVSDRMRFLNCSVCEEDGGVIKGAVSDQNPFPQFVLLVAIGLDDSSAVESPCTTVDRHLIDNHYYFYIDR